MMCIDVRVKAILHQFEAEKDSTQNYRVLTAQLSTVFDSPADF